MSERPLARRVALVTGAGVGIGKAIAELLAARGASVAVNDLDARAADETARALGDSGFAVPGDIADETAVAGMVAQACSAFGGIDILVNNAGIGDGGVPTLDQTSARFERTLSVHLGGAFLTSRAVVPRMKVRGGGAIVNLGSIAGIVGIPERTAYSVAKAGIGMMTRVLACEWARYNIRVNAVAPGYVRTDLLEGLIRDGRLALDRIEARTPLGRMAAPQEIAEVVAFLVSPPASYVTGAVLPVDGGYAAFGGSFDASGPGSGYDEPAFTADGGFAAPQRG